AERMVQRRGPGLVFVGRVLPGIPPSLNLSCGAGQMGYGRVFFFVALGAALWGTHAALLGHFSGEGFARPPLLAPPLALGVALLVGIGVWLYERRQVRREREAPEGT